MIDAILFNPNKFPSKILPTKARHQKSIEGCRGVAWPVGAGVVPPTGAGAGLDGAAEIGAFSPGILLPWVGLCAASTIATEDAIGSRMILSSQLPCASWWILIHKYVDT